MLERPKLLYPAVLVLLGLGTPCVMAQESVTFSAEQVEAGKALYQETCQICHGSSLANGQFGTPLRGNYFRNNWKGKSAGELMQFVYEKMPPDNLMSLAPEQIAAAVSYILSRNDVMPADTALTGDHQQAMHLMLPWQ